MHIRLTTRRTVPNKSEARVPWPNIGTNSSSAATAKNGNDSGLQHVGREHARHLGFKSLRQETLAMVLAKYKTACCLQVDLILQAGPLPPGGGPRQHGMATCQQ